ncbi:tRNA preQ1(34) S-adenosylmethionine ribosyltransferase-isomerase QueA [bacterium]|nr:tRNA preQ1(34) S-adenosylmethionine ribosyltransferase-isomerase QueA [bacterium]
MKTSNFDYTLPEKLIAQFPMNERHNSRLMVIRKKSRTMEHLSFIDIADVLSSDYMIVINNTKVFPARLKAKKQTGGKVEILLIRQTGENKWLAMVKPSAKIPEGTLVTIDKSDKTVKILHKTQNGKRIVQFSEGDNAISIAHQFGITPLPPYIKRDNATKEQVKEDKKRYQTIFADKEGSVAAPTASLHFSNKIIEKLYKKNIPFADLTLHVGPGTFAPVKSQCVYDHVMEFEYFSISSQSADKINSHIKAGGKILPVGTTVVRTLESIANENGKINQSNGKTDLFIYPGYKFKTVKSMLTNFHLPKSTLLMLICALADKELIMKAYQVAVREKYRFYSYGDAMLILDE